MNNPMPNGNPMMPTTPEIAAAIAAASQPAPAPAPAPAPTEQIDWANQFEPPSTPPPAPQAPAPVAPVPPQQFQPRVIPPQAPPLQQPQAPQQPQPAPQAEDPFDINALLNGVSPLAPVQQAPVQQPVEPVPSQPLAAPPQPTVDRAALRQQAIDQLMRTNYQLNDADQRMLLSEPDKVIPRIAAEMHVAMAEQNAELLRTVIGTVVPQLVQQQLQNGMAAQRAEIDFYSKYPTLNRPEFRDTVVQSLVLAKQTMPQGDRESVMRRGAQLAALEIRSKFGAPQAAPRPNAPFVPAVPGSGQMPNFGSNPSNPFEAMANDEMRGAESLPW